MVENKSTPLPFDVLQLIVDNVYDTDTLRNLSLTSMSLLPLCRAHLFNSIKLQITTSPGSGGYAAFNFNNLASVIRGNPSIGGYVKKLLLIISVGLHPNDSDLQCLRNLPILLRSFTNIETLRLQGLHWDYQREDIAEALSLFISQPGIKSVEFYSSTGIPFNTLVFPPSLQQLIISKSSSKSSPSTSKRDLATTPKAHIAKLHLGLLSGSAVKCLTEEMNVELDRLTSLYISGYSENNIAALNYLFSHVTQSLRDLEVGITSATWALWFQDIDIVKLESVENITISISTDTRVFLQSIGRFFATAPDKNSISTIEINVDLSNITVESEEWGNIHDVLAGQKFRNLLCFRIVFNVPFRTSNDQEVFMGYISRQFSELSSRGICSFVFNSR